MCIKKNRFIPFLIWVMGGCKTTPPPMDFGSGKSPMDRRVNENPCTWADIDTLLASLDTDSLSTPLVYSPFLENS